jgi:hypothetical protein
MVEEIALQARLLDHSLGFGAPAATSQARSHGLLNLAPNAVHSSVVHD